MTKTIINIISDYGGQGTIRNIWPFSVINTIYGSQRTLVNTWYHNFPDDPMILENASAIYFQRQMSEGQLLAARHYEFNQQTFGYKMVWDMDDMIWGLNEKQGGSDKEGIPVYNSAWERVSIEMKKNSVEMMKLMNTCTFSTQYLADYVEKEFGIKNSVIVPNTVQRAYWGEDQREPITENIEKPRILYTGSPSHYSNKDKHLGDWDNAWKDWVIDSVNNDEIEMYIIGVMPWFFEEIKDKITLIPWVPIFALHLAIKKINPHFCINPLIENQFNSAKSDLKQVESSAAGMACVGTVFDSGEVSPYDHAAIRVSDSSTVEDIKMIIKKNSTPAVFNSIIIEQYKWMEENDRYTESPKYINKFIEILT